MDYIPLVGGVKNTIESCVGYSMLIASLSVMGYSKYKTNKVNINASDKKAAEIITDGSNLENGKLNDLGKTEGAGKAADFEKKISKMSPNDRVAAVKTEVNRIVNENGLIKDNKLTKINNRDVYRNPDTRELFAVDTQHGRFESLNPKNGKHLCEVDFDFNPSQIR